MRHVFTALIGAIIIVLGLLGVPEPAHASLKAGKAFSSLTGNTTLDSGGAIHSQTRSIYSLGGGMTTFQGKRITFLAADPPSFSAGCSGISWHFGGFSFISMDELRQLVEAVAQASLGVAVDLAMQTLCPQCYAVMSKLRDIANTMRNAAADACRISTNMGAMLASTLGLPDQKQTECSTVTSSQSKSDGFLHSVAGSLCRSMDSVNDFLTNQGETVLRFLNGNLASNDKTPPKEVLDKYFNVQYEILSALGYQDGPIKDLLLNFTGMTIYYPVPVANCSEAFRNLTSLPGSKLDFDGSAGRATNEVSNPSDLGGTTPAKSEASGTTKNVQICHMPPRLEGIVAIGNKLVCGFNVAQDIDTFSSRTLVPKNDVINSSIGMMCSAMSAEQNGGNASVTMQNETNPVLYSCDSKSSHRCTVPHQQRYSDIMGGQSGHYTGLAWAIADALYSGMNAVGANKELPTETIAILNGSGYPLYRLINLAAVYPGMAMGLMDAYAATIAVQYAVDTLDKMARPGALSSIEVNGANANIKPEELLRARENIANMFSEGGELKERTLKLMSQKRALVQSIIEINRTLQADVISRGLSGNASFALSVKKEIEKAGTGND